MILTRIFSNAALLFALSLAATVSCSAPREAIAGAGVVLSGRDLAPIYLPALIDPDDLAGRNHQATPVVISQQDLFEAYEAFYRYEFGVSQKKSSEGKSQVHAKGDHSSEKAEPPPGSIDGKITSTSTPATTQSGKDAAASTPPLPPEELSPEQDRHLQRRRNDIQEHIMVVSEQLFFQYKKALRDHASKVNFWLGSTSTVLAGIAAVTPIASSASWFAGASGATSGIRTEWNSSFLGDVTTEVIIPAIELRRAELATAIREKQSQSITVYGIAAAVEDAIVFHGAATLSSGLEKARETIAFQKDPGIVTLSKILTANRDLRSTMSIFTTPGVPDSSVLRFANSKTTTKSVLVEGATLSEAKATALIAQREKGDFATIQSLETVIGVDGVTVLRNYLTAFR